MLHTETTFCLPSDSSALLRYRVMNRWPDLLLKQPLTNANSFDAQYLVNMTRRRLNTDSETNWGHFNWQRIQCWAGLSSVLMSRKKENCFPAITQLPLASLAMQLKLVVPLRARPDKKTPKVLCSLCSDWPPLGICSTTGCCVWSHSCHISKNKPFSILNCCINEELQVEPNESISCMPGFILHMTLRSNAIGFLSEVWLLWLYLQKTSKCVHSPKTCILC